MIELLNKIYLKNKSYSPEARRYLVIMGIGGSFVLTWGWIFENKFDLKIPFYVPVALLCYAGFISMFFQKARSYANVIYPFVTTMAFIHHLYLLEVNNFHSFFLVSSMLAISIGMLPIFNLEILAAVIAIPNLYLVSQAVQNPSENRILMVMAIISMSAVNYYFSYHRHVLSEKIRSDHVLIEQQREKAVNTAKMAALGEMAGGVAHEINNPLAIISGKTQQLQRRIESGESGQSLLDGLRIIQNTTTRIEKIVKGLRSFARDADRDPFEKTSINYLVEETLGFCRAQFRNSGVKVTEGLLVDDVNVECRSSQISQVILNLLNNARDASMETPEPWVNIFLEVQGQFCLVHVVDSGNGIPKEIEDKMFQPFFTTKPVGKGTGLGLSVSRGIVDSHKGFLKINHSSPHTEFVLGIPIAQK